MHLSRFGASSETVISLVPGGPCLPGYLGGLRDLLKGTFGVDEIDLRDSVLSNEGPPFSMESYFEDLNLALKSEAKDKILLGHSAGALISLAYVAQVSPDIDGLILLNPGPLTERSQKLFFDQVNSRNKKLRQGNDEDVERLEGEFSVAKGPHKAEAFLALNEIYWPAYFKSLCRPDSVTFRLAKPEAFDPIFADYQKWFSEGTFLKGLEKIEVPVLMIHGDFDPVPHLETKSLLSERIKNFQFSLIDGAGHFPWYEAPKDLLSIVEHWFREYVQ